MKGTPFYLGDLFIEPQKYLVHLSDGPKDIQPRLMEVLSVLCSRAGRILSADELVERCWPDKHVSDNPVHKCIAELRRALNDNPKAPRYIKTVARKGYMVVAPVAIVSDDMVPFWINRPPYPGVRPYTFSEASIFFGRRHIIEEIGQLVEAIDDPQSMWLSLYGPPRCGKTSLIHGGITPYLEKLSRNDSFCYRLTNVLDIKAYQDQPTHVALLSFLRENGLMSRERGVDYYREALEGGLDNQLGRLNPLSSYLKPLHSAGNGASVPILVIDHLDHAVVEQSDYDVKAFVALLDLLCQTRRYLLITSISQQYLPRLENGSVLHTSAFQYAIPEFNQSEIAELVRNPAAAAGLVFEYNETSREDLGDVILREMANEPAPIEALQTLLHQLYMAREQNRLTYASYQQIGGIGGCLAEKGEAAVKKLPREEQDKLQGLLFSLVRLNAAGNAAEIACSVSYHSVANGTNRLLVDLLLEGGVLRASFNGELMLVQLAHSSLIISWPRVRNWIESNIDVLYARRDLQTASERWVSHGRRSRYLGISDDVAKKSKSISGWVGHTLDDNEKQFLVKSKEKEARGKRLSGALIGAGLASLALLAWLTYSINDKNTQLQTMRGNAESLSSAILHDLKEKLEPIDRLDLIEIVGSRAQAYFAAAGTRHLDLTALTQWVETLNIMGKVSVEKLEYDKAREYFENSQVVLDKAPQRFRSDPQFLEQAMITSYWLGYIPFKQKDYGVVSHYWQQYLAVATKLVQMDNTSVKWLLEKSYALTNLGSLAEKTDQLDLAAIHLKKSAALKGQVLARNPGDEAVRSSRANTLSWQATVLKKTGKLQEAKHIYETALKEAYIIHSATPDNYKWMRRVVLLEHRLAIALYDLNLLKSAAEHSLKAYELLSKLTANDPENARHKQQILWTHLLLAKINRHEQRNEDSLEHINQASSILGQITSNIVSDFLPLLQQEQARLFGQMNQNKAALVTINQAIETYGRSAGATLDAVLTWAELFLTKAQIQRSGKVPFSDEFQAQLLNVQTELLDISKVTNRPKVLALYLAMTGIVGSPTGSHAITANFARSGYGNPDFYPLSVQKEHPRTKGIK